MTTSILFPRTFNINELFDVSKTESNTLTQKFKLLSDQVIKLDPAPNISIVKNISVVIKGKHEVKNINMLINNSIIEKASSIGGNREVFKFQIFTTNGVVLNPRLFNVTFRAEPKPLVDAEVEIHYTGFKIDNEMNDFLKYNQYYSVHLLPTDAESKKVLAIYYTPALLQAYCVKFIELNDIKEFNDVVKMEYEWQCPIVRKLSVPNANKENKYRIISVEITYELEKIMTSDPLLNYESMHTIINQNEINKSYIVCIDEQTDVEAHLLSEYGLISYVTISKLPQTEVNCEIMQNICENQNNIIKRLGCSIAK